MNFRYRYVPFGTAFLPGEDLRSNGDTEPEKLYANELVVDVGGVCRGYQGEQLHIYDHHFFRADGQFPSASAAVLHHASDIHEAFAADKPGRDNVLWLVTHRDPDFDAFCAMYLVRSILDGSLPAGGWERFGVLPDGWRERRGAESGDSARSASGDVRHDREIDWFKPDLSNLDGEPARRAAVLLAAYAACVDNCRRSACSRTRALHSVLYAAITRGRNYMGEESGAVEFFRAAREAITVRKLNPLVDSVLENNREFTPELSLLDREGELYQRDIKRSRRAMVDLLEVPFQSWFPAVEAQSLFSDDKELRMAEAHLQAGAERRSQTDGIYLRDPECLLFKEWARLDTENSSLGTGFIFSAIAYSSGRPGAAKNKTSYFFSLDPERAGNRHLYNVWARLQAEEVRSLRSQEQQADESVSAENCRKGFEGRAGTLARYFDDPWFDGANYRCTIVATPARGTLIGEPGNRSDLSDDPVTELVRQELELSLFHSQVKVRHLPATLKNKPGPSPQPCPILSALEIALVPYACLRFAKVRIKEDVGLLHRPMSEQIGRTLWRVLEGREGAGVPSDFSERHLLINVDWVGVWSRRGAAIAYKESGELDALRFERLFEDFASLSCEVEELISAKSNHSTDPQVIETAHRLTGEAAKLKRDLALPENRLPSRFFEAVRFGEVLEMVRDVQTASNIAIVAHVQGMLEWIEIFLVSVYAAHLSHMIGFHGLQVATAAIFGAVVTAFFVLPTWRQRGLVSAIALLVFLALLLLLPQEPLEAHHMLIELHPEWQRPRYPLLGLILIGIFLLVRILRSPGSSHLQHQAESRSRR